jgi:prepilin-type N-terminal cleavage/methylation domain-containing protein
MRRPPPSRQHLRGFTLIEMAVVVLVLGLVASGTITLIQPLMDGRNAATTSERMDQIERALRLHVIRYRCLPCPTDGALSMAVAASDGGWPYAGGSPITTVGTCATAACQTADAVVPWRALGLSEQDITDGWGNRIRYAVSGSNAVAASCGTANLQLSNSMARGSNNGCYPSGDLTVTDLDGYASTTNAAYVLISNGPDKSLARRAITGGFTGDRYGQTGGGGGQDENQDGDTTFSTGQFNGTTGATHFDDIVKFATAANIIQLCGSKSCGNP